MTAFEQALHGSERQQLRGSVRPRSHALAIERRPPGVSLRYIVASRSPVRHFVSVSTRRPRRVKLMSPKCPNIMLDAPGPSSTRSNVECGDFRGLTSTRGGLGILVNEENGSLSRTITWRSIWFAHGRLVPVC